MGNRMKKVLLRQNRIIYLDYMRIAATIAVMVIHVCASRFYVTDVNSIAWKTYNVFDSISRWSVPVFVMISGALFLPRTISIKVIYKKYILKMIAAYIIWSIIYVLPLKLAFPDNLLLIIDGHYHMWFIKMIIGIYICIPLIKPIVENENRMNYFLALFVIITVIVPSFSQFILDFTPEYINEVVYTFKKCFDNMNIYIGYIGYFVLGYYLDIHLFDKKQELVVYLMGIMGFIMTISFNYLISVKAQEPCENYYTYFMLNVFLESLAVFVFLKNNYVRFGIKESIIAKVSKCSFVAYLVHVLVIEGLDCYGFSVDLFANPIIAVVIVVNVVFCISFSIAISVNKSLNFLRELSR